MKKVYERPVMKAEIYETNAYCSSCGASFANGMLEVYPENCNSTNNGNGDWEGNNVFNGDKSELRHTFENSSIYETVSGLCGNNWGNNTCDEVTQSIWKCTCTNHPGETWYLEWSHYYTKHMNGGKDTFFLYKESNNKKGCTITPNTSSWPGINSGTDINVAQVIPVAGMGTVVNS